MSEELTVVLGAGLMGAASAWALARRGRPVMVIEQFAADHDRGSSHGSARIVRRAYGDALYVGLTGRAFELWRELEHAADTTLLRMLGGLDFGATRNVPTVSALLATHGVEHEVLPAVEAEQRWPGMRFAGDVVFHPQAGTVDSAGAVRAMLAAAGRAGAQVRHGAEVLSIRPLGGGDSDGDGVEIRTSEETIRATQVVLAAGAWTGPLAEGLHIAAPPLRVTQEQVFHFRRLDPTAPAWPSVIHEGDIPVYHLAGGADGGPGDDRKIGQHDAGATTTARDRDGRVSDESRRRVIEYVREWLPGLDPTPSSATTCLYTRTPSEDFLLDRAGPVVLCSPCSGHGAKFAPLIGEFVADLVTGAGDVPDRFRVASHASGRTGSVSL